MADVIYTGKGLASNLPKDNGSAMGRLSNFITKAEELKYQTFKQNEQEFLKTSNVDPAFFISTANQNTQAKLLDDYNKRWATRMKESNNNLSLEDKQAMQSEKNFIITSQQEMQAKQDLWQQHRQMIQQNPTKYDQEEWSAFDKAYRESGEYPITMPPIKAKSLDMALEKNPVIGNEIAQPPEYSTVGGVRMFADVTHSGSEADARERVKQVALMDEAYTKDLALQFRALDPATKLKYLDVNKDGHISKAEEQDVNPIIQWAQDTKWQQALKVNRTKPTRVPTTPTKSTGYAIKFGGRDVIVPVGQKRSVPINYGGEARPNLYSFGGSAVLYDLPTEGGNVLYDTDKESMEGGSNVSGQLIDYDKDNDMLIIRTTTGVSNMGIDSKQLVEIPAGNIPDVDRLPILKDGKQTTLGEIRKGKVSKSNGELDNL